MSILGSVGFNHYVSGLDYVPSLVLQTDATYQPDFRRFNYHDLCFDRGVMAPYCPVHYITGVDTVDHISGVSHKWSETRYFFN